MYFCVNRGALNRRGGLIIESLRLFCYLKKVPTTACFTQEESAGAKRNHHLIADSSWVKQAVVKNLLHTNYLLFLLWLYTRRPSLFHWISKCSSFFAFLLLTLFLLLGNNSSASFKALVSSSLTRFGCSRRILSVDVRSSCFRFPFDFGSSKDQKQTKYLLYTCQLLRLGRILQETIYWSLDKFVDKSMTRYIITLWKA
jgi:hypothetical protein